MTQAKHHGKSNLPGRPSVLIFDVNETLIDFESMNPLFERVFGDKQVMREWLGHLIMYSMTLTLSGLYKNYWALGGGLIRMVGAIHKIEVSPSDVEELQKRHENHASACRRRQGPQALEGSGLSHGHIDQFTADPGLQEPARARRAR